MPDGVPDARDDVVNVIQFTALSNADIMSISS
jgi:hypothetical protein